MPVRGLIPTRTERHALAQSRRPMGMTRYSLRSENPGMSQPSRGLVLGSTYRDGGPAHEAPAPAILSAAPRADLPRLQALDSGPCAVALQPQLRAPGPVSGPARIPAGRPRSGKTR